MNVKIIIVALCALQLAKGSAVDDVINKFQTQIQTQIQTVLNQAQSLIQSAQQQYNATVSQLASTAQSRLDELLQNFQKNIGDSFSDAADAASRVPSCLQAQQQNLSAIRDDASQQIQTLVLKEAFAILPLVDKVNATINEGRSLLNDTVSKLSALRGQSALVAAVEAAKILALAAQNATKIAGDVKSEAQQIAQVLSNIPNDVQASVSSYIDKATDKLKVIAKEVEQCVRNPPPS